MKITPEQAIVAVCTYVKAVVGTPPVVRSDADGVRPTPGGGAYYTVREMLDIGVGSPSLVSGTVSTVLVEQVQQLRQVTYTVTGYGASRASLETIASGWRRLTGYGATLRAAGVSVSRVSGIRNIAAMIQSGTEPRWSVDLDCYYEYASATAAIDEATSIVVDVDINRGSVTVETFAIDVEIPE